MERFINKYISIQSAILTFQKVATYAYRDVAKNAILKQ